MVKIYINVGCITIKKITYSTPTLPSTTARPSWPTSVAPLGLLLFPLIVLDDLMDLQLHPPTLTSMMAMAMMMADVDGGNGHNYGQR